MATITGTNNAETLTGTNETDLVNGFGGDDTLIGGNGNDTLDGGPGVDTGVFSGLFDEYSIAGDRASATVTHLTGSGGTDLLTSVLFLQFDDQIIELPEQNTRPVAGDDRLDYSFAVNEVTEGEQILPEFSALPDGRSVVVWRSVDNLDFSANHDVKARIID